MATKEGRSKIVKFFLDRKVGWYHVQGILVNMQFESGLDSGSYVMHDPPKTNNGPSGGLCHWHDAFEQNDPKTGKQHGVRRLTAMINYCGGEGAWQMNWEKQCEFLLSEEATPAYLAQPFKSPQEAAEWFTQHWERPANAEAEGKKRSAEIKKYFDVHKGKE
jgi:hypothetical protein